MVAQSVTHQENEGYLWLLMLKIDLRYIRCFLLLSSFQLELGNESAASALQTHDPVHETPCIHRNIYSFVHKHVFSRREHIYRIAYAASQSPTVDENLLDRDAPRLGVRVGISPLGVYLGVAHRLWSDLLPSIESE